MKRILLLLMAFSVFGTIQAQKHEDHNGFRKGDAFISGLVGFNSTSHSNGFKETEIKFSPRFGYFLNDFTALGGRLGYGYHREKNNAGQRITENSTIVAEVFSRYYLLPGSQFSVFGELAVGFGTTKNITGKWDNGVNAGFSPGLSYFVGQHFALEAIFGVLAYHSVSVNGSKTSTDSFRIGLDLENINFGIIYKF